MLILSQWSRSGGGKALKWDTQISCNEEQKYSTVESLIAAENSMPPYAYCLPRYAKLNGVYRNAPNHIPPKENGFISKALSGEKGEFAVPPVLTVTFDRLKTSNGIRMTFNPVSGDYPSSLKVSWYKDDVLIKEQTFSPDGTQYFCRAKVPLFNKFIITFLKTNRPHRYLWIAALRNQRMIDAGGLKIVYDDIALGAKENAGITATERDYYVDLQDLKRDITFPDYALCLPRYAKMSGEYSNAPDGTLTDMGYVSDSISDQNGTFTKPPKIIFTFSQNYSSVGITLKFNDYSGDYCDRVNIRWYRGEELLLEKDYVPDSVEYFCYGIVDLYNKVEISFLHTNKPYRNVFLTGIKWGLTRIFRDDEIEDIDCLMELSPLSEEVSINTMEYTIRSKTDYAFEFQKRQKQKLYFDEAVLGIFYLHDGKQLDKNRYTIKTQDAVGLLDGSIHMGGIYEDKPVKELLDEIMQGEQTEYFLDDTYRDRTISGYLPIGSKRSALQQLAFAIGAAVDTSYDRKLYIYPQQTELSGRFSEKDVFTDLTIDHDEIVTGVRLYAHAYTPVEESAELYKGVLNGSVKVEFPEPCHSLKITGGTLGEYGVNYAYITGAGGEVLLSGSKYRHSTIAMLKENPNITQNKNIAEIKDAVLVSGSNASEVLNRVYDFYQRNESIRFRAVIDAQELGDRVEVETGFKGKKTGTITKLNFQFSRHEITAEVTVQ